MNEIQVCGRDVLELHMVKAAETALAMAHHGQPRGVMICMTESLKIPIPTLEEAIRLLPETIVHPQAPILMSVLILYQAQPVSNFSVSTLTQHTPTTLTANQNLHHQAGHWLQSLCSPDRRPNHQLSGKTKLLLYIASKAIKLETYLLKRYAL